MPNTTDDCRNAGRWKTRKTKGRFSVFFHCPWKSLLRFPHSRSREGNGWKSGNPKAGFPLFHRTNIYYQSDTKKEPSPSGALFLLQAYSWIRKCCG